ncbi:MAG: diacylglycerol kinase [Methylotenera sp.]|nr:MAG: diacylglycerol kinase [Methylotenera sp.]
MTIVSLIVAVANHQVIGFNNTLPWHLPEDLKRFRALTTGHHIIMGRKTYQSLNRLLPDRTTVIVTRNPDYHVEGALIAHSLEAAIAQCQQDSELFIIGGAELYKEALQVADKLYITQIELEVTGDAYFPTYDQDAWHRVAYEPHIAASGLAFSYATYERHA